MAEQVQGSHQDLERRLSEMTRDLATLYAITSPISGASELKGVLTDAVAMIMQVTGADAGTIRLVDPETNRFMVSSYVGLSETYVREAPLATGDDEMLAEVLRSGQPAIAGDLVQDPRTRQSPLLWDRLRSAVYLPLKTPKRNLGVVVLGSGEPGRFTASQGELFAAISRQISTTIENVRLFEEAERRRVEAEELARVARSLTESLDVKAVADRIVEGVRRLLDVADVTVYQLQDEQSLLALAVSDDSGLRKTGSILPVGTGVAGQAVVRGEPVFSTNILHDPKIVLAEFHERLAPLGDRSVLAVPLRSKGQIIGALSVSGQVGHLFTEAEVSLLQNFGDQAALALENARLYEQTERRGREAEELARVAQSLTESLDMAAVGERIVTSVRELFGVKAAMLRLLQPDGSLRTLASSGEVFSISSGGDALPSGAGLAGLAVAEGRPFWSADVLNEPRIRLTDQMRDHQLRSGNRSMIAVPLRAHEKIIGSLGLSDRTGRVYSDGEVELLQTFAAQGALALENARLFEETERRAQEISALHEIGTKLVSTLDLSAVLEEIAGSAIQLIGAQRCAVFELDPGDQRLHMRASRGMRLDQPFMPMKLGQGAAGSAALQRQPVFSPDVGAQPLPMYDEAWEEAGTTLREVVRRRGYRAILAVPLVSKETGLGAICIYWDEIHAYDEREVQLLTALAQQAAVAIENARLFEEIERRAREQAAVNAIATAVSRSLHLDELLQTALDKVLEVTGRECGYIRLKDPVTGEIKLATHRGISDAYVEVLLHGRTPGGKTDHVLASGEPLVVNDPDGTGLKSETRREGRQAIVWIPLKARGEVIGILNVATTRPIPFTPRDVELLQSIGNVIGVAVENARLFEETQRRNLELQALYTVTNTTTQSLDIKSLTQTALLTTIQVLGVDAGRLYVFDETGHMLRLTAHHGLPVDELSDYQCYAPEEGVVGQIFSQNRPVVFADLSSDPNYAAMARSGKGKAWGFRSAAGLPITAKGRPVGVIYVNGRAVRQFAPQDLKLLSVIGEQIGVALENARLYEEAERRRREAEELGRVSRTVVESLDVSAVGQRIVESVLPLFTAEGAVVWLVQPDDSMVVLASTGPTRELLTRGYIFPAGVGLPAKAVAEGRPVWSCDVLSEDDIHLPDDVRRGLTDSGTTAVLAAPLRAKGKTIGALVIRGRTGRVFSKDEVALLETFAAQGALALENARLYEAERTRQEQLNAVRKVGQEVSTELELEPLLHLIVRRAVELAGVSSGIVYTLEAEVLVPRAWWNLGPWLSEVRFRLGQGIPGIVAQSGQAMIINDYLNSPYVNPLFKEHSTVTALIAMPLISKGKVVGVITINNSTTDRRFSEADQALLSLLAPQAASAIENARLFEEAERRRREAEELARMAQSLTESLDMRTVGERVVESVLMLFRVDSVVLRLLQPDGSLVALAGAGPTSAHIPVGHVVPPGVATAGKAVLEKRPIATLNVDQDAQITMSGDIQHRLKAGGTFSALSIPLRAKGEIIGSLSLGDQAGRIFSEREVALLQLFGDQAALALENARLYENSRRLVEELKAITQELGYKNKELDTFVYTVSHDLKAPLVTLQGMADLLVESCGKQLDEQGQHYVTRIRANAQQMERLVQDLLALSRIGREGREPEAVALDEVTDEILMEWGERIRARGVTVTRHELPTLWGVRTQIEQVVSNLVGNAIKYLGDTPAPVVEIGAKEGGEMVECYVKDNGIGIDPAYHEKVFEIFQRLKETETEGTGVGLAIVKKIVEGAGGVIWVESAKGQGAAFRFTWPRAEVAA